MKAVSTEILGDEQLQSPAIAVALALCSRDQRQRKSAFFLCLLYICYKGPEAQLLPEAQLFEPPLALYWEPQADRLLVATPMEWQWGGSWP